MHDAVEDQGGAPMLARIRERYGETVADIVAGCTDAAEIHKPSWRPRKERYLAHLRQAPYSVRLVSADKLHNARAVLADLRRIGDDVWARFTGGRQGTLWYYRAVVDALRQGRQPGEERLVTLIAALDRVVTEMEHLAGLPPSS